MIKISEPIITQEEKDAVMEVLNSGQIVQGPKVALLERQFSNYCGVKYSVAVNNGTSALHTALYALGIRSGDEVITTPFSFVATANAILMAGAKPVFVDIDKNTLNIDPSLIEAAINKKTKAIIAVDLYGQPADYTGINKVAKKYGLYVVEDAAQSIGASFKKHKTGSLTDIACFSLYATKNIMSGEGGMITTKLKRLSERSKLFRHHGQNEKLRYSYSDLGYNYRMTDIQAAIALVQMKRIDQINKKRKQNATKYNNAFKNIKGLEIPFISKDNDPVYHQYTLKVNKHFKMTRDQLKSYLMDKGIQSNIYYPIPLHKIKHLQSKQLSLKNTQEVSKQVLSIPVHPQLSEEDTDYIIKTILTI